MKTVVIGESSGATMETIMAVYHRHKAVVDTFVNRGEVIGISPFADRGNMAILRTREAAEAFVKQDPFILEGLVKSFVSVIGMIPCCKKSSVRPGSYLATITT